MEVDNDLLRGTADEVVGELFSRDLYSGLIALTMSEWENERNEEGNSGWGQNPQLFLMLRNGQLPGGNEVMTRQALCLESMELPAIGASLDHMVRLLAKALDDKVHEVNATMKIEDGDWDFCAWMLVSEALLTNMNDQTAHARLIVTVDRAKCRYTLIRPLGDDEHYLMAQLGKTGRPERDSLDDLGDALCELVDATPGESPE